eukprot:7616721-Lingulodinium_polyedra.AAC.1
MCGPRESFGASERSRHLCVFRSLAAGFPSKRGERLAHSRVVFGGHRERRRLRFAIQSLSVFVA